MKQKSMLLSAVAMMTLLVSVGCDAGGSNSVIWPSNNPSTSSDPSSDSEMVWPDGYEDGSGVGQDNYRIVDSQEMGVTLKEMTEEGEDSRVLDTLGTQQLLVIPICFTEFPADNLTGGAAAAKTYIENAFFGEAEDTGWESVASYYTKSSYGKLNLTGFVTDWFDMGLRLQDVVNNWTGSAGNSTWSMLRAAVEWYRENWETNGWPDIKTFDQDSDGRLDAVWLVNSAPIRAYNSHDLWAFTFSDYLNPADVGNPENPVAYCYASASYNFLTQAGYSKPDAHTMIHETGHVLGVPDYYTYDSSSGDWGAAGGCDMMDNNVGDHNSFTKTLYGWTSPYIVEGDAEITLRPFQENGDCIILKNGWNGSGFDEFLILEYYTPTGLNEADAAEAYMGVYPKLPSRSGIKIYHVDARLANLDAQTGAFLGYTDEISDERGVYTTFAHSNTRSRSVNTDYRLLHLLESTGRNSFIDGGRMNNLTLFKEGSNFGLDRFIDFTFNDGTPLDYIIQVTSVTDEGATIVFNAKQSA